MGTLSGFTVIELAGIGPGTDGGHDVGRYGCRGHSY